MLLGDYFPDCLPDALIDATLDSWAEVFGWADFPEDEILEKKLFLGNLEDPTGLGENYGNLAMS
jgi:hypothetical protein